MEVMCFNCKSTENLHNGPFSMEMRQKWMDQIPDAFHGMFTRTFRLCSEHFDSKYFTRDGRITLNAVPTKFIVHNVWFEVEEHTVSDKPYSEEFTIKKPKSFGDNFVNFICGMENSSDTPEPDKQPPKKLLATPPNFPFNGKSSPGTVPTKNSKTSINIIDNNLIVEAIDNRNSTSISNYTESPMFKIEDKNIAATTSSPVVRKSNSDIGLQTPVSSMQKLRAATNSVQSLHPPITSIRPPRPPVGLVDQPHSPLTTIQQPRSSVTLVQPPSPKAISLPLPRPPATSIKRPRSPVLSIQLPRPPATSIKRPRSPVLSIQLPRSPATSIQIPRSHVTTIQPPRPSVTPIQPPRPSVTTIPDRPTAISNPLPRTPVITVQRPPSPTITKTLSRLQITPIQSSCPPTIKTERNITPPLLLSPKREVLKTSPRSSPCPVQKKPKVCVVMLKRLKLPKKDIREKKHTSLKHESTKSEMQQTRAELKHVRNTHYKLESQLSRSRQKVAKLRNFLEGLKKSGLVLKKE